MSTLEEHTSDQFLEEDPLGSVTFDPQTHLFASLNENHHEPNDLQDASEKMLSGQYSGAECEMFDNGDALNGNGVNVRNKESVEGLGNGNLINGSLVDETNKESIEAFGNGNLANGSQVDETNKESVEVFGNENLINGNLVDETNKESVEASSPDFHVHESLAPPENVEQDLATPMANTIPFTADVIVETFPLRPVTSTASRIESFGEFRDFTNSPEKEMKILDFSKGKESSELNSVELKKNSSLFDEKSVNDLDNILVNQNPAFGNKEEEKDVGHTLVESTKQVAFEEHFTPDFEVCTDHQVKVPHQSTMTSEAVEQSRIIDQTKVSLSRI